MITINGKTYIGNNISINGDKVYIDGKPVDAKEEGGILSVEIQGNVSLVDCDVAVRVSGDVLGSVRAGNSVHCGNVSGDVKAGNSINCGNIGGNAKAGNSINKR